jgi:hypothetical protein
MAAAKRKRNTRNRLETQAEGRRFAVAFLKKIRDFKKDNSIFAAATFEEDEHDGPYLTRKGPQSSMIRDAFDRVYAAPEAARKGFFQIITDQLGTAPSGWYDPEGYEQAEERGGLDDNSTAAPKGMNGEERHV